MAEAEKIPKIDPAEVEILIEQVKQNKLGEREAELIAGLLRTLLSLVALSQDRSRRPFVCGNDLRPAKPKEEKKQQSAIEEVMAVFNTLRDAAGELRQDLNRSLEARAEARR